jgi:biopolymer transport protein ExbD
MAIASENSKGTVVSDINVTPMVDVMLVLLIIFIVIAPSYSPESGSRFPRAIIPSWT